MTSYSWSGYDNYSNVSDAWGDPGNWVGDAVPTIDAGDTVYLTPVVYSGGVSDDALFSGGLSNGGVITFNAYANSSYGFNLILTADTTLSGGGTIELNSSGGATVGITGAHGLASAPTLENVDNTIEGSGAIGYYSGFYGNLLFENDAAGTVEQTGALGLTIATSTLTNAGLVEATGSGGLYFSGGNVVDQSTGGSLIADGGDIYLSAYTQAGATIIGGTMTSENGAEFLAPEGFTLDGTGALPVTITAGTTIVAGLPAPAGNTYNGSILFAAASGQTSSIVNKGTIAPTTTIQGAASLVIGAGSGSNGVVDLSGGGTVDFTYLSPPPGSYPYQSIFGSGTLVNVDNTIEGVEGQISADITNQAEGKIELAGATLNASMVNSGLVEITSASGLLLRATVDQSGGGQLLASDGDVTMSSYNVSSEIIGGTMTGQNGFGFVTGGAGGVANLDGAVAGGLTISADTTVSDVSANAIVLDATDGQTASIINHGSISASGGSRYSPNIYIGSGDSGGAATVNLSGGGNLTLNGGWIINGLGGGHSTLENADNTIEGDGVIWGQDAQANLYFVNDASGLVDANVSGQALQIKTGQTVVNNGTLEADAGTLQIDDAVSGAGSALVTGGGAISFSAGFDQNVRFSGTGSLDLSLGYAGTISGFAQGDVIDLTNLRYQNNQPVPSSGDAISVVEGGQSYTLNFDSAVAGETFQASADASGNGTDVTVLACYARGTRIMTNAGEVAVEALRVGDLVVTASGGLRPIVWIGHRAIDLARHPDPAAVRPVRVAAGAFGEGLPLRDLWLSPSHNVACEGALTPISALLNGVSVAQIAQDHVEYWHVELDAHDVILAEGLPAESYLDTGNRTAFANGGAFVEAHPDFRPRHWAETCLPLVLDGPAVAAIRARLLARLAERGFGTTQDAGAQVWVDGRSVEPVRLSPTRFLFALPAEGREIMLRSNTFVPAHTTPQSHDTRTLGLCVAALQIDGSAVDLASDAACGSGWRRAEYDGERFTHRWTTGATPLACGARIVILDLAGVGNYWRETQPSAVALTA